MKKRIIRSILAIVEAIVIGLLLAVGTFFIISPQDVYVTSTIQFTYDGAANGVDPNGNRFSAEAIISDGIIKDALESLDWSDTYDASLISKSINVVGLYPKDIVDQITGYDSVMNYDSVRSLNVNEYYSTVYSITLNDNFSDNISKSKLSKLLGAIIDTYEQSFYREYSHDYMTETLDSVLSFDGHDYTHQIRIMNAKINMIKGYSNSLHALQPTFISDGVTFKDLALKCSALQDNKLNRMNISITMNGLTKNANELVNEYEYTIETLNIELDEKTSDLNAVTSILDAYDRDSTLYMGSGDGLIKVESNSGETYDALAARKVALGQEIASVNTEIAEYQRRIDDIKDAGSNDALYEDLESDIEYVEDQLAEIKAQFDALTQKYDEKYVLTNSIGKSEIGQSNNSVFSFGFIATCIKCIAPFGAIAVIYILIEFMVAEVKAGKKRARKAQ
ncbi:MAG: hypothetical protein MJ101_05490 [Clostridia bacterium]|nr:hypothetical protein [Clostridia bacterium]